MIPGANILNMAMSLVAGQSFDYFRFVSRETNDIGLDVSVYADGVPKTGSVQAVPRSVMVAQGLDLQRNYVTVYTSNDVRDVRRDVSGDYIVFNGKKFQCVSATDWYAVDGWIAILCIEVPNE